MADQEQTPNAEIGTPGGSPAPEVTPVTTSTPEATPGASEVTPSTPSGETPAGGEKTPEQTPAEKQAAEAAGDDDLTKDPQVPWAEHRKLRRERQELKRQNETHQRDLQTAQQQLKEALPALQEVQELRGVKERFTNVANALRRHPDILAELDKREMEAGRGNFGGGATPPRGGEVEPAWAKTIREKQEAIDKRTEELHRSWQGNQTQQAQARQEAEDRETSTQVDASVRTFLGKAKLAENVYFEDARDFVIKEAALLRDVELDDIPFLLGRWLKRERTKLNYHQGQYVNGKNADRAALPPATPANPAQVQSKPSFGANDGETSKALEQGLRSLGWQ